jgi:hypothetical protein
MAGYTEQHLIDALVSSMVDNSSYAVLAGEDMPLVMRQEMESSMSRLAEPIHDHIVSWATDSGSGGPPYEYNLGNPPFDGYILASTSAGVRYWTPPGTGGVVNETDPIFIASPAYGITSTQITNWDTAYGWGDHSSIGYELGLGNPTVDGYVLASTTAGIRSWVSLPTGGGMVYPSAGIALSTGSSWGTSITDNSSNWNTAYGWGDHALVGYLTSETSHADVVVDGDFTSQGIMLRGATAGSYSILTDNSSNWNTAYGWGDHSGLYRPVAWVPTWDDVTNKPTAFTPINHGLVSSYHTVSGLTTGHFLRASGSTTYGFAALLDTDIKPLLNDWFELVGTAPNQYIRCKYPFAGDYDIQGYTDFDQFPPTIWESMPLATTLAIGGVLLPGGTTTFLRGDGTWASPGSSMVYPSGSGIPIVVSGTSWGTTITNNSSNWNTAYGWGNHASAGYYVGTSTTIRGLLSSTATGLTYTSSTGVFSITSGYGIPTTTQISNWNTAYGWGDHSGLYSLTTHDHGDIASAGTISSTAVTPASTDYILISDTSASNAIKRGILIGTGTTTYLRNDGTWATPAGGTNYWQRSGTLITTATAGDDLQIDGDVWLNAAVYITSAFLDTPLGYMVENNNSNRLGIGTGLHLMVITNANRHKVPGVAAQTHPTLSVWSNADPEVNPNQYIAITHNGTDGVIWSATGVVKVDDALTVTGALTLSGLSSTATAYVLYYNSTTGVITYGDVPSGGSGITGTGSTGRIAYWTGASTVSYGSLYWNNANNSVGIGISPSNANLHVSGDDGVTIQSAAATGSQIRIINTSTTGDASILFYSNTSTAVGSVGWDYSASPYFKVNYGAITNNHITISSSGYVGIGGVPESLYALAVRGHMYMADTTILNTAPSTTTSSGFRIRHGAAPSSPSNGDVWTTTSGMYVRINGTTVGPLGTGGSGVTPVDSTLLDWSTDRYQPYASAAAGALYTGAVNPSGTTRLNYGGYLYATRLYSGGEQTVTLSEAVNPNRLAVYSGATSVSSLATLYMVGDVLNAGYLYLGAATTTYPSIRIPHGTAPTSPTNGDMWTTTSGIYVRINGTTVGPLGTGGMVYPAAGIALSTGSGWGTSITNNSANWDTAYTHSTTAHQTIINGTGFVKASGTTLSYDNTLYQAAHANLSSLVGLTYASDAFVKMTGAHTFSLDTSTYLTSITKSQVEAVLTGAITSHTHSYEPALGNPAADGRVLSSTAAGVRSWIPIATTDHGALTGLADDDHPQYYNQTRGDARYSLTGHTHLNYAPLNVLISSKTTAYTVQSSDNNKIIECSGTFTVTLPDSMTTGFQVTIVNVGTGVITIAATTTIYSKSTNRKLASQWIGATAYHRGSDVWVLMGDLTA